MAHAAFSARRAAGDRALEPMAARLETFTRQAGGWLEHDALYEVLADAAGGAPWTTWPDPIATAIASGPTMQALRADGSRGDRLDLARRLDATADAWRAGNFAS